MVSRPPVLSVLFAGVAVALACDGPQGGPGLEPPDDLTPSGSEGPGFGNVGSPSPGVDPGLPTTGAPEPSTPPAGGSSSPPPNGDMTRDEDAGTPSQDAAAVGAGADAFAGRWVVDQPFHALYEATLYELAEDGSLIEHATNNLGGDDRVTGSVEDEGGTRCTFEGGWRAPDPSTLVLDAACSDRVTREVTLSFPDGDWAQGVAPGVASVDGEGGWDHRDFGWQWRRCPDTGDCPPF